MNSNSKDVYKCLSSADVINADVMYIMYNIQSFSE